ncbi:hypothetical protein AeMF1_000818 [Aphanomyces euteiches]|nr:hypothetical protein AeMF1_000818 [Aphanomyces euteiches]
MSRRSNLPPRPLNDVTELELELEKYDEALKKCVQMIKDEEKNIENHKRSLAMHEEMLQRHKYEEKDLNILRDGVIKRISLRRESKRGVEIHFDSGAPPQKKSRVTTTPPRTTTPTPSPRPSSPPPRPPSPITQPTPPRRSQRERDVHIVQGRIQPQVPVNAHDPRSRRSFPDDFWSTTTNAKLLSQVRHSLMADGSDRKLRCSVFHPAYYDVLATSSDEGMLRLWQYESNRRTLKPLATVQSKFLRKEDACTEGLAWNPTQPKLAVAFRDPIQDRGGVCVVEWSSHDKFHSQPSTIWNGSTSLHSKGVSCIAWLDASYFVTGGAKHKVVCWNYDTKEIQSLHQQHRSEVRTVCPHSFGNSVFSGALDGTVIQYDFRHQTPMNIKEFRKPLIGKVNSILEHPANPHLLMFSCIYSGNQTMLFHDLRQRSNDRMPSMVWFKVPNKAMSQYITPRWSSAGMHVSCGSTTGDMYIWDIRACKTMTPAHQTVQVHSNKVLHGLWHATQNAIVTISHDRNIGVVSFQ